MKSPSAAEDEDGWQRQVRDIIIRLVITAGGHDEWIVRGEISPRPTD